MKLRIRESVNYQEVYEVIGSFDTTLTAEFDADYSEQFSDELSAREAYDEVVSDPGCEYARLEVTFISGGMSITGEILAEYQPENMIK